MTSHALGGPAGSRWMLRSERRWYIIAVILKVWGRYLTPTIDEYLLEEQSFQIASRSDLKRRSLRLFLKRSPQQEKEQQEDE